VNQAGNIETGFSESDRNRLIELSVDMGYMKRGLEGIRRELTDHTGAVKSDVKELWLAIEELRKFRWWLAGVAGGASVVGGAFVKLVWR
jgi:hypothetical protein